MGEHLADQLIANLAAALFFALALKLSFVSFIPTALRLGAGCGISMLVSVLGLRSLGLLVANSFTLQPFTWQNVSGRRHPSTIMNVLIKLFVGNGEETPQKGGEAPHPVLMGMVVGSTVVRCHHPFRAHEADSCSWASRPS